MINFIHFGRLIPQKGSLLVAQIIKKFPNQNFRLFVFGNWPLKKEFDNYQFNISSKYLTKTPIFVDKMEDFPPQFIEDLNRLKTNLLKFQKESWLVEFADTDVLGFDVEDNKRHFISKYGEEIYQKLYQIWQRRWDVSFFVNSNLWHKQKFDEFTSQVDKNLAKPWYRFLPLFEDQRFYYLNWQSPQIIDKWLRVADVNLMPSIFLETFGLSALESLARWVPVIAPSRWGLEPFVLPQFDLWKDWMWEEQPFFDIIEAIFAGKVDLAELKNKSKQIAQNYTLDKRLVKFTQITSA